MLNAAALLLHCVDCVLRHVQVKSVCDERLSLANGASAESEPANTSDTRLNSPVSQTADRELSTADVQTDHVTRKYYEVSFHEITSVF